jgi:hypothetical protein
MGQQPMAQCVAVTRHHYYLNQLTQKTINQGGKMNNLIHKKLGIAVISGCLMMWVGIAQAAPLVVFSNGGVADADDVNANFNELGARIETISLTPGADGTNGTNGAAGAAGNDGAAGADSTVAGPKGDTGADSTVAGPKGDTGADSTVAGPKGDTGADSTVAGPKGDTGLGAVVFSSAPTVNDDMNNPYSVGTVWVDTSTNRLYILEDNTANSAVWTIAAAPAVTYALGDTGPAGGFVFYVTGDGLHGLEAAPEDIGGNASATLVVWGCNGTLLSGMNELGVGSGVHNTSQRDLCSDASTAAKAAAAYEYNGYTDWFLPSKAELDLMYHELADTDNDSTNSGVGDDGNPGGFASNDYWSSSQDDSNYAWAQYFESGLQGGGSKDVALRVRAVRAF